MKAAFLVDSEADSLTFRELQARRDEVREKLAKRRKRGRRAAEAGWDRNRACPSCRRCRR